MDQPQTWISILAFLVAAIACWFTRTAARATKAQAEAAIEQTAIQREQTAIQREQTAIQRQLREDAAQPYLWVDVRPTDSSGKTLIFVIGNSGPTVATDVRVSVDPALPEGVEHFTEHPSHVRLRDVLSRGIRALAPGREIAWIIGEKGQAQELALNESGLPRTVRISGTGPFGPLPVLEYVINLGDLACIHVNPPGSIHILTQAVERVGSKLVERVERVSQAVRPEEE